MAATLRNSVTTCQRHSVTESRFNSEMTETIGQRVRAERESKKISRAKLASLAGISATALSDLELGYSQTSLKLHRIAAALGVETAWLETGRGGRMSLNEPTAAYLNQPIAETETPTDYVRVQQLDAEAGMGGELVNDDNPEVVRAMDFTPSYIRGLVGFLPPPGRLVLVTGRGDSMIPVIQPGDIVMVDTGTTSFDGDGIYLINTGGGQQIKALQHRGDGIYVVSANAGLYPAFLLRDDAVIGGKVYLRNRIERFN